LPIAEGHDEQLEDKPKDASDRRTASWVAGAAFAVVAITAVVLYDGSDKPSASRNEVSKVGLACEPLRAASNALARRQEDDLIASLKDAEKAALRSLDESGQRFGRPERMALEASAEDLSRPLKQETLDRIRAKLTVADEACEEMSDESA